MGRYAVLCQALFQGSGEANPLVTTMWNLYATLTNAAPLITERFAHIIVGTPLVTKYYHTCIVRAIQVNVQEYLQEVSVNVAESHMGIEPLEFRSLVVELKRGTFQFSSNWVPIPEGYLEPVRVSGGGGGHGGLVAPSVIPAMGPVRWLPDAPASCHR